MRDDPAYAAKAARISVLAKDIGEILSKERLPRDRLTPFAGWFAFHNPCSLHWVELIDEALK